MIEGPWESILVEALNRKTAWSRKDNLKGDSRQMIIKTRKHVWPAALVVSLAIVGVLAAFLVLAATPGSSSASRWHAPRLLWFGRNQPGLARCLCQSG